MSQGAVSIQLLFAQPAAPETVTGTADVPVAQLIDEVLNGFRRIDEVIDAQTFIHQQNQAVQAGENPAVQLMLRDLERMICRIIAVNAGVERQECMRINECIYYLGFGLANQAA
ncbi:hypothetical protein D3C80_1542490 [compost metagenome]